MNLHIRTLLTFVRKRAVRDALVAIAALITASIVIARFQAFFLRRPSPLTFDDGDSVALGERMIDGHWLPYVDGYSHRGPLLYWAAALAQKLSGRFNWIGSRWLSIVTTFSTLAGTFAAPLAARRPIGAAIAVLVYADIMAFYSTNAWGVLGETVASPLVVWSLAFCSFALMRARSTRARALWLMASGVAAALAGFAKQTALAVIVPVAGWALITTMTNRVLVRRERLISMLAAPAGFSIVVIAVLGIYAVHRALGAFWYWFYQYNAEIYMQPEKGIPFREEFDPFFAREHWILLAMALSSIAVVSASIVGLGRKKRAAESGDRVSGTVGSSRGFELTIAALTVILFAGAAAPMRFWPHYFISLYPLAALLGAIVVERAFEPRDAGELDDSEDEIPWRFWGPFVAVIGIGAFACYAADAKLRELRVERKSGEWASVYPEPICDYIDKYASPGAPIFIWGFDADLYVTCKRSPASRFLSLTFVAGTVPGRGWDDPRRDRVARGAREDLVEDLRNAQPPVLLDMPGNLHGISMTTIPELMAVVNAKYCIQQPITSKSGRIATPWLQRIDGECP